MSDNTLTIRSLWSKDSLFFRFDVKDHDLWATQTERDDSRLYLDDMCEVLLDPREDGTSLWLEDDLIYHVNLLGTIRDDRGEPGGGQDNTWNGQARISVELFGTLNDSSDSDEGYTITIAIPWSEIGRKPRPGTTMGLNLGMSDRDSDQREKRMIFLKDHKPTRCPSAFGTIILK